MCRRSFIANLHSQLPNSNVKEKTHSMDPDWYEGDAFRIDLDITRQEPVRMNRNHDYSDSESLGGWSIWPE